MRNAKSAIFLIICALFISGCGTKRQYFEPSDTSGRVRFNGSLSSDIEEVASKGASLGGGKVITYSGEEQNIKLEKGYSFLGEFDGRFVTISPYGVLHVKDKNNTLVYERDLNVMIASAAIDKNTLAVVTANNALYIFDMSSNETVFQKKMDAMSALDSRIAVPYFLGSLVIFPTLDGKLAIVDRNSGALIRNVVVSAEREFNNIIFLDVVGDRMFAATSKRIIGISPTNINYIDEDVKDAVLLEDRIFIFEKDGNVVLADLDLKILSERKFPFAIFAGAAVSGDKLYIVEKRGYLIKSDLDLKNYEIFDFPSKIEDFLFIGGGKIFYGDRFYTLE
jgi:outer membrane lipoprotein-sorting protein